MTVRPLETRYKSCLFRSRLEARWAVFFDVLGVQWLYEPQGFEVERRLDCSGAIRYLPDFWIPSWNLWVEVKGHLTDEAYDGLMNIGAALSDMGTGCGGREANSDGELLVLGNVPDPAEITGMHQVHLHKGDLYAIPYGCTHDEIVIGDDCPHWLGCDAGGTTEPRYLRQRSWLKDVLTDNIPWGRRRYAKPGSNLRRALSAARSARFEHGQSGEAAPPAQAAKRRSTIAGRNLSSDENR